TPVVREDILPVTAQNPRDVPRDLDAAPGRRKDDGEGAEHAVGVMMLVVRNPLHIRPLVTGEERGLVLEVASEVAQGLLAGGGLACKDEDAEGPVQRDRVL